MVGKLGLIGGRKLDVRKVLIVPQHDSIIQLGLVLVTEKVSSKANTAGVLEKSHAWPEF